MSLLKRNRVDASLLLNPIHFLSLGFGSGLSPIAPGTAGTVAAIPIYWLMSSLAWELYFAILVLMFIVGIYLCQKTTHKLGSHDHSAIVWDEVVGYLLTMALVPFDWMWAIVGFFLFRLFDVWKPWPVRLLDQKVSGGFGIMLDDIGAAIYSALSLHGLIYFYGQNFQG